MNSSAQVEMGKVLAMDGIYTDKACRFWLAENCPEYSSDDCELAVEGWREQRREDCARGRRMAIAQGLLTE